MLKCPFFAPVWVSLGLFGGGHLLLSLLREKTGAGEGGRGDRYSPCISSQFWFCQEQIVKNTPSKIRVGKG